MIRKARDAGRRLYDAKERNTARARVLREAMWDLIRGFLVRRYEQQRGVAIRTLTGMLPAVYSASRPNATAWARVLALSLNSSLCT